IGLIVSGGHTSLYHITSLKNFKLLGQTRDDAAGEAFDKVARILKLGYPGGPIIDKLAQENKKTDTLITFKGAELKNPFDFSFSGIKTAVLYYRQNNPQTPVEEIAFAFQKSVVTTLVDKALSACQKLKVKTLLIGGGVAANSHLRAALLKKCTQQHIALFTPPLSLCVDNAAMIAGFGYHIKPIGRRPHARPRTH
ncbi:MAG TPA: tRNA (adenosine(37)-N6)-threonylcarbamoyltransferase complex transferase subunit TsaD, partial [Candidatus Omnitrophota bacterium]|nr:tRNA (adenosine(37)-N6)-threonylcarbamoyltransferase complex transferase subunit TsaD [Candidatus Omnitrophota bacterium]